eukprot:SAG22_NODE_765_length_7393_cov_5.670003_1_plen_132_part_00
MSAVEFSAVQPTTGDQSAAAGSPGAAAASERRTPSSLAAAAVPAAAVASHSSTVASAAAHIPLELLAGAMVFAARGAGPQAGPAMVEHCSDRSQYIYIVSLAKKIKKSGTPLCHSMFTGKIRVLICISGQI